MKRRLMLMALGLLGAIAWIAYLIEDPFLKRQIPITPEDRGYNFS